MERDEPTPAMLVEAILVSSRDPVTLGGLAARLPVGTDVAAALADLSDAYRDRAIMLAAVPGGWCIRTRVEYSDLCRRMLPQPYRLSRAAIETLAVIAYLQPVTRPEIERIRGVSLAKGTLDLLIWAGLVMPGPRRATPGTPMTFLTTEMFLRQFDLPAIGDLPLLDAMRRDGVLRTDGIDPVRALTSAEPAIS